LYSLYWLWLFVPFQSQFALIVDDSRVDSYTISNILTHEFIKNTIELCPEKVIDLLKKTPAINIIILDYEMPIMNGCELMQAIKSEFVHRDFIFISSTGNRNGSIKLLNMGVDEIFTKPMDVEIFTISLRKLIFNKHQVKINKNALADYKSILKSITKGIYDPMYVLLTINDCLIDDMLDKNKLEEIKNICDSSKDKLKHTFDDLLSYLEVTSYVESPALKPCSLQSMIAAQLFLESSLAKMRNIIIKKTFDVDLKNLHVPQQIEQVVNHLTHNAILQSKKNSEINVRLFIQDLEIVFEVEDSRESSLERQYETSHSDKASIAEIEQLYHDQPLNFSLCRKVIDSHGGLMGIKRGKIGNVVYFKLPVSSSLNQNVH